MVFWFTTFWWIKESLFDDTQSNYKWVSCTLSWQSNKQSPRYVLTISLHPWLKLVVLKLTARKIAGSNWLQKKNESTSKDFKLQHLPLLQVRTDWKHRSRIRPNWPENTIHTCCQNISNESQSNTSKWDMGCMNYCALPLPLVKETHFASMPIAALSL